MEPEEAKAAASRRNVVGGVGVGLAAVAMAQGASAQMGGGGQAGGQAGGAAMGGQAPGRGQAMQPPPQAGMQNPLTQYPRPPFPRQQQDWPGLAQRMQPRPDHGETSYRGSGRLSGRRALVTGGDSGIGRAAAIAFAREGADVAINYLPVEEPDAREVMEHMRRDGRNAVALPGDIREEAFATRLVNDAVQQLGGLDILVLNAGAQTAQQSIADITTEQFDRTFRTNVYAPFWMAKAALPHLQPGASIIITASIQAYEPSAQLFDYAQTKACNVAFAKSLAKQLAPRGIRVNAVAPGPFWTPLQPSGGATPETVMSFGGDAPLGRPGQPAEIAPTYVLLASQETGYVTGEVFGVTGGNATP